MVRYDSHAAERNITLKVTHVRSERTGRNSCVRRKKLLIIMNKRNSSNTRSPMSISLIQSLIPMTMFVKLDRPQTTREKQICARNIDSALTDQETSQKLAQVLTRRSRGSGATIWTIRSRITTNQRIQRCTSHLLIRLTPSVNSTTS